MRNVELMFEPDSRLGDGVANGLSSFGKPEKISYYFPPARTQRNKNPLKYEHELCHGSNILVFMIFIKNKVLDYDCVRLSGGQLL